jgi:hypothetical protein
MPCESKHEEWRRVLHYLLGTFWFRATFLLRLWPTLSGGWSSSSTALWLFAAETRSARQRSVPT